MSMLDRIRDSFKYLDKNGLKHLIEKIKAHDVHWTGTHAEYEAVKDTIPAYAILHFTDDYDDGAGVHPDWAHAISLTVAQLTAGYTAPEAGMIAGGFYVSNTIQANGNLKVEGVCVGTSWCNTNAQQVSAWDGTVPVNKGDVIRFSSNYAGTTLNLYPTMSFVPWKI